MMHDEEAVKPKHCCTLLGGSLRDTRDDADRLMEAKIVEYAAAVVHQQQHNHASQATEFWIFVDCSKDRSSWESEGHKVRQQVVPGYC